MTVPAAPRAPGVERRVGLRRRPGPGRRADRRGRFRRAGPARPGAPAGPDLQLEPVPGGFRRLRPARLARLRGQWLLRQRRRTRAGSSASSIRTRPRPPPRTCPPYRASRPSTAAATSPGSWADGTRLTSVDLGHGLFSLLVDSPVAQEVWPELSLNSADRAVLRRRHQRPGKGLAGRQPQPPPPARAPSAPVRSPFPAAPTAWPRCSSEHFSGDAARLVDRMGPGRPGQRRGSRHRGDPRRRHPPGRTGPAGPAARRCPAAAVPRLPGRPPRPPPQRQPPVNNRHSSPAARSPACTTSCSSAARPGAGSPCWTSPRRRTCPLTPSTGQQTLQAGSTAASFGCLSYPWILGPDPFGNAGAVLATPASGHLAGFSRATT